MADPGPPIHDNPGKLQLVPKIAVQSQDPEMELPAKRRHDVLDAADGTVSFVAKEVCAQQYQD